MPLGQFLFEYLYRRGVRHSFGIPGDFVLPTFTWLDRSKIQNITMTHEPAAVLPQTLILASTGSVWFASLIAWAGSTF